MKKSVLLFLPIEGEEEKEEFPFFKEKKGEHDYRIELPCPARWYEKMVVFSLQRKKKGKKA